MALQDFVDREDTCASECPLRVLLVGSNSSRKLLESCHYKVIPVSSSSEAASVLKNQQTTATTAVDIVMVDSESSGREDVLELAVSASDTGTPIVVAVPETTSREAVVGCLQSGATECLTKPLRRNELMTLWQHSWRAKEAGSRGSTGTKFGGGGLTEEERSCERNVASPAPSSHSSERTNQSTEARHATSSRPDSAASPSSHHPQGANTGSTGDRILPPALLELAHLGHQLATARHAADSNALRHSNSCSAFSAFATSHPLPVASLRPTPTSTPAPHSGAPTQLPPPLQFAAMPQHMLPPGWAFTPLPHHFQPQQPPSMPLPNAAPDLSMLYTLLHQQQQLNAVAAQFNAAAAAAATSAPMTPPTEAGAQLGSVTSGSGAVGGGEAAGSGSNHPRRAAAIAKFREKRNRRNFDKKVRYQSRKKLAEERPRVRGQFVKREEMKLEDVSEAGVGVMV